MTRSLPRRPSLRYLREEAKDLIRSQRTGDASSCPVLRRLRRFTSASEREILSARVALHEGQLALAIEYGFRSWKELLDHVRSVESQVVFRDPRRSSLHFRGDADRQDTLSLAVTAALHALGRPADYGRVYELSTNPFAPDIRPEEPTRGHWQCQGRDRCLDLIAMAHGASVRSLSDPHVLSDIPPMPEAEADAVEWLRRYYAVPAADYLGHAIQAGEIVVSCGEWAGAPGLTWRDWGVVTESRHDGTILGAGVNGRTDNLITHVRDGWVLRPTGSPAPETDVALFLLQRIVQRIRSAPPVFGPGERKVVFGISAMDAWIEAMGNVPFDREQWQGQDHSAQHARQTAMPTFEGARAAARCLRRMAAEAPVPSAGELGQAADQYGRITELLQPALADDGPASYGAFMGDPDRQRQHIDEVLKPVRDCLESVASHLERAVEAPG